MKHIFLFTSLLLGLLSTAFAEQTVFSGQVTHGGYGAPVVKFTNFNGEFGVLAGGQGGWIINHTFMIGGGGYGLATNHHPGSVPSGFPWAPNDTRLSFGYGGLILSYIGKSDQVLHPTFDLLIGGGSINGALFHHHDWMDNQGTSEAGFADNFFVVEPTVNAELNLVSFMRMDVGAGYRFVSGVSEWGLSNSDVSGLSGSVSLKFGKF